MVDGFEMDRRGLLRQLALLAGATVALDGVAAIGVAAQDSAFRYSAADMALLNAVADRLVPTGTTVGALDVGVPALLEGLMANWASPATRAAVAGALAAIDRLDPAHSFASLPAARQHELLRAHDAAALAPSDAPRLSPLGPPPVVDPAYQRLKQLVLTLFYLSQPALTQELAYTHVPGRWDASVPVTPATRPQGGPGMF